MKNGEKWRKLRKNQKSEAAKARSGSRGPPAETGNRKPKATKARSGQQGTPSRNRKPETGSGNEEKW